MSTNKIIRYMYFRMEAPLLDWPNFTCMSEIPFFMKHQQFRHVFLKSSAPIPPCKFSQSVKHASRIMRKDMFFFFRPCCVFLSESLMSRNKKGNGGVN